MSPYFTTPALFLLSTAIALGLTGCQPSSGEPQQQGQAQPPVVNVQQIVAQSVALDIELAGRTSAYTVPKCARRLAASFRNASLRKAPK